MGINLVIMFCSAHLIADVGLTVQFVFMAPPPQT